MSHFQSPDAMRQFWREVALSLRKIFACLATIVGIILAIWCAADKEWNEATFFLVMAWWAEVDYRRLSDNG